MPYIELIVFCICNILTPPSQHGLSSTETEGFKSLLVFYVCSCSYFCVSIEYLYRVRNSGYASMGIEAGLCMFWLLISVRVYKDLALCQGSERVRSALWAVRRSVVKTPPSRWKLHPVHGQSYAMQFARVLRRACETSGFALWWMPCVI